LRNFTFCVNAIVKWYPGSEHINVDSNYWSDSLCVEDYRIETFILTLKNE